MPLGTLDRTPPPFFKQGMSALTKLLFFSALALFIMVADTRFQLTQPLRAALATVLHPVERVLLTPLQAWATARDYLGGITAAREREAAALQQLAAQAERAARVEQQRDENTRLRDLLGLRPQFQVRTEAAEVLYEAADPYTRKIVIDRGATHGIVTAAPVIDAAGVLGQVTRVYPLAAEVTLLTDKDAAIPVLNTRTQARGAAYGDPGSVAAGAGMELRFLANNADIEPGDLLHTSGVDGIYPPGLPVAKVVSVDRRASASFARVVLAPMAVPDSARHVLVLEPLNLQLPSRPADPSASEPVAAPRRPGVGRR
jgi:rod shape-determining protein MreC